MFCAAIAKQLPQDHTPPSPLINAFMNSVRLLAFTLPLLVVGCGGFGAVSIAEQAASKPGLSDSERVAIYERAGDDAANTVRAGAAVELYYQAALVLSRMNSAAGRNGVDRLYNKCIDKGLNRDFVGARYTCTDIRDLNPNSVASRTSGVGGAAFTSNADRNSPPLTYAPPTGSDPSGPQCATGQREIVQAQSACASGNSQMCVRAEQLKTALRNMNCSIPVLGAGSGVQSSNSSQGQPVGKPSVNHCIRLQRTQTGAIELYNTCAFAVSYSYCVQGPPSGSVSSSFNCGSTMDGKGNSTLAPGKSSFGFQGNNVIFAACEGSGSLAVLKGGQGSCR